MGHLFMKNKKYYTFIFDKIIIYDFLYNKTIFFLFKNENYSLFVFFLKPFMCRAPPLIKLNKKFNW